jgi:hypothetical protein
VPEIQLAFAGQKIGAKHPAVIIDSLQQWYGQAGPTIAFQVAVFG